MSDAGGAGAPAGREQLLAGRYRLLRLLAEGGMAAVWEGRDEVLARSVAVKVPHARLAADPTFRERFRREAVAAARLAHPGIVATYDTGADGPTDFIVMELVPGRTVGDLLAGGPVPAEVAVSLAAQVAEALDAAHQAGVVHRDIKPANLLLVEDGPAPRVKVADFGVAWARAPQSGNDLARGTPLHDDDQTNAGPPDLPFDDEPVTREGLVVGTARYLAPEQVAARPVDGRTDVYAVGCVLHEMLAGRPPFVRGTDLTTALAHLTDPVPSLGSLGVRVDPVLERLVLACLAKEPGGRPASALLLAQQLRALTAPTVGPPTAPVPMIDLVPADGATALAPAPTASFAGAQAPQWVDDPSGGAPPATAALPVGAALGASVGAAARAPVDRAGPSWAPPPPRSPTPAPSPPASPATGPPERARQGLSGPSERTLHSLSGPSERTLHSLSGPSERTLHSLSSPPEPTLHSPSGPPERTSHDLRRPAHRGGRAPAPAPQGTRTVGRRTRSRAPLMLVGLLVLAALATALVVVATAPAERPSDPSSPGAATSVATGRAVVDGIRSFDPEADGRENDGQLPRLLDGDPATTWSSEDYSLRPVFGNLKKGVGLVLDLDRPVRLERLLVRSPSRAWAAQVYVAGEPASTLAGWGQPVAGASAVQGDLEVDLDGTRGGAVLVWFTDPGRTGQVVVGELELGTP